MAYSKKILNSEDVFEDVANESLVFGIRSIKGQRPAQHNSYVCKLDFFLANISLFALFSGHGGAEVAVYASEVLPNFIKDEMLKSPNFEDVLKRAILKFDVHLLTKEAMIKMLNIRMKSNAMPNYVESLVASMGNTMTWDEKSGLYSGCTALVVLIVGNKLYAANVGDSRCVVAVGGTTPLVMSKDHKPNDSVEEMRIKAAGGKVTFNGRVCSDLNVSRSLGNHFYKSNPAYPRNEQIIIASPNIQITEINVDNGDFIVLGCGELWDSLSNEFVVDHISKRIKNPRIQLSSICKELFDLSYKPQTLHNLCGLGNLTCIIVKSNCSQKKQDMEQDFDYYTFFKALNFN